MSAIQQILAALVTDFTPPPAAVEWNPADKAANITLSGSNKTATKVIDNAYAGVRATLGRSTGKYYFEVVIVEGGTSPFITIGVNAASESLNNFTGSSANGWGYYQQTGEKTNNGATTAFGASYATGDVVGIAVDFGLGYIWFAKNDVWQTGDPVTGTSPAFTGLSGTLFPTTAIHRGDSPANSVTGRFASADFTETLPSGFSAWD